MRRTLRAVLAAGAAVLLAGCGALQVRTSEEGSGAMGVRVAETAGPEPTPTETGPAIPDGYTLTHVPFQGGCAVPIQVVLPDSFSVNASSESYVAFTAQTPALDQPSIEVYCTSDAYAESAVDHIETSRNYSYTETGTTRLAERKGQLGNGYFWSYQIDLSPQEIFAGQVQTMMYGALVGYTAEGRLYSIRYSASTRTDDADGRELLAPAAEFVEVDGHFVPMPDWV